MTKIPLCFHQADHSVVWKLRGRAVQPLNKLWLPWWPTKDEKETDLTSSSFRPSLAAALTQIWPQVSCSTDLQYECASICLSSLIIISLVAYRERKQKQNNFFSPCNNSSGLCRFTRHSWWVISFKAVMWLTWITFCTHTLAYWETCLCTNQRETSNRKHTGRCPFQCGTVSILKSHVTPEEHWIGLNKGGVWSRPRLKTPASNSEATNDGAAAAGSHSQLNGQCWRTGFQMSSLEGRGWTIFHLFHVIHSL